MIKPFGALLEDRLGCDSVHKTSLGAGSVVLNGSCSHVKLVRSLVPEHGRMAGLLLFTNTFFLFFKHLLGWMCFFFSVGCLQVSVGRHLNITEPGFLDFSAAILSALQRSLNPSSLFALLFGWDESLVLRELTGELPGEFLLLQKWYRSLIFMEFYGLSPIQYS